eukprot:scaffold62650_cov34-Phaeocystis_antarctica.AAC.2
MLANVAKVAHGHRTGGTFVVHGQKVARKRALGASYGSHGSPFAEVMSVQPAVPLQLDATVVTTSAIPSHPSTALLDATLACSHSAPARSSAAT